MINRLISCVLLLTLLLAGQQSVAQNTVKVGQYRAVLKTVGGDLPFGLDIQPGKQPGRFTVLALNGSERLLMDEATLTGDSLHIPMSLFESELVARVSGETLTGFWKRRPTTGPARTLPFVATLGQPFRFVADKLDAPARSVAGTYATVFVSADGKDSTAKVGVFEQRGNHVTGTFLTPTGDYRFLDGNMVNDSLLLSTFDGSNLYLLKAKRLGDGRLVGSFRSGVSGFRTFVARPDATATLPDPNAQTFLKSGYTSLDFRFPQPDGTLITNKDERFRGKVTVIQLLGTWCPNCMDETNFMSPWYKKNHSRGVEVVGLSFETTTDLAIVGPKINRMKQRFQIDYPVVLAGSSAKEESSKALPTLNRVAAFPTTIFIDKKGVVRQIHTGFNGPSTGKYYDEFVEEFNRLVDKLLAE